MTTSVKKRVSTKMLTRVSLLSVIGFLIYLFDFPLGIFPEFLKLDLSDLPALIGSLALGPIYGVVVQLIKNLLHLMKTTTGGIGELANFLVGSTLVYTAGYIYNKKRSFKSAALGMFVGVIAMSIVGVLGNYLVFIPLYAKFYGIKITEQIAWLVSESTKVNESVIDIKTLLVLVILPFNLIKGIIISVITIPIYKRISPFLRK